MCGAPSSRLLCPRCETLRSRRAITALAIRRPKRNARRNAGESLMLSRCKVCGKPMGMEAFLGPVCGKCVRVQHKRATKGLSAIPWRKNPALPPALAKHAHLPGFREAYNRYVKFHGCPPTSLSFHKVPMGRANDVQVFTALGEAPAESYRPLSGQKGSNKSGTTWVHKYEGRRKPIKAVDPTGKLIITLPGRHKVTDWIRG